MRRALELALAVVLVATAVYVARPAPAATRPPPYHVTVQVGQDGTVYHTTCRKLHHVSPVYIFSSCRKVRVIP